MPKKKLDDELLELAAKRLRQTPDEYQNWALSCAADLKKMEPMQQIYAKHAIAAIIMEGQLGLLHRNSVKINAPTVTITSSTPTPNSYGSTPSPRYFMNYSNHSNSEPEQRPQTLQQDYQQNMNNIQQVYDADNANTNEMQILSPDILAQYIKFNK